MPKTVFNFNTPVSADWFNTINGQRLRFDGNPSYPNDLVDGQYYPIRLQDLDPAILAPYVLSLDTVNKSDDQIINGFKTFTQPLIVKNAVDSNHATNKGQLDSAISTINTAIAVASGLTAQIADLQTQIANLNSLAVKVDFNQTIAGQKTFNISPQIPLGVTPGAAVNLAQLSALLAPAINTGIIKIGYINIIFGRTALSGNWNAGGAEAFSINYSSAAPTFTGFNTPPTVVAVTDRLLSVQLTSANTNFSGFLDTTGLPQPDNCTMNWVALGYI